MRNIILLFSFTIFLAYASASAQGCSDIADIPHSWCDNAVQPVQRCNFPNEEGKIKSWCSQVVEFVTSEDCYFLRFYLETNALSCWFTTPKDVCKKPDVFPSGSQLKKLLQLTYVPKKYAIVKIPKGTRLIEGRIDNSTDPKCRQFCLVDQTDLQLVFTHSLR